MPIQTLFPRARAAEPAQDPVAAVRELNQQYITATHANDAQWFRRHLADDVVVVQGGGRRLGKAGFLAAMADEPRNFRSLELRDVTLRAFGSTVQVDADAPWELADGTTGVSRYIDTWTWLDGRWQVISAQVTLLPP